MASNRSKRMLQSVLAGGSDNIPRKKKKQNAVNSSHIVFPEANMGAPESPIPEHNEDDLIQLQDLLGDVFNDENENGNCDKLINDEDVSPILDEEEIIPPSSSDLENYESSTLRKYIACSSSENNPQNASDTPVPSPIHSSHHNCNSQFCSNCLPIQNDSPYPNFDAPTPSTVASIGSPYTPSRSKPRKKTYKTDESKKRKVHKENWQSTQRKKNKNEGKSFTTAKGKLVDEKTIKDPCTLKCRMKCFEKFSKEQRLKIFKKFWSIGDRTLQWKYVLKYTEKVKKARHTIKETKHNRQFTYSYYLPSEEKKTVKVCKTMFLNTISSGERIVSTAWKKDRGYDIIEPDNRGKHHHKKTVIDEEMIRSVCDHVNSFPLVESHRIRKDSKKNI
ncbi:uncharacterized protein LOC125235971 [Leguminivora glycinivorella]|uniref:uncharacterized protein LOC125235971 n=1 Tax=Leguminivora glycinivorella TaxID=1035111 RepID=UPI00200D37ED|nr:uncharacterized protein LOC125235971 [Leguminivora glycinivorella]